MLLIFYGSGFRVEGSHLLRLKPRPAPASSCPRSELRNEGLRNVRQCEGLAIHGCFFSCQGPCGSSQASPGGIRLQKQRRRDGKEVWVQARSWTILGTGFGGILWHLLWQ